MGGLWHCFTHIDLGTPPKDAEEIRFLTYVQKIWVLLWSQLEYFWLGSQ